MNYQPKTGHPCHCKRGRERDNCPACEGTGQTIDFARIRAAKSVPTVYEALLAAGVPLDSHESDLYCKATPEARTILRNYSNTPTTFRHAVTGETWLDIPFAYDPWWKAREAQK